MMLPIPYKKLINVSLAKHKNVIVYYNIHDNI